MPKESEGFHGITFTDHWIRVRGAPPPLGTEAEKDFLDDLELLYRNAWQDKTAGDERRSRLAIGFAEVLFGLDREAEAFDWIRQSLAYAPETRHRLKSAAMLRQGGELDEAASVLQEALRLDPALVRAHFDLGELARAKGAFDEAIRHYQAALSERPDFANAHAGQASALRELSRLSEALEHYREADRLSPDNPLVLEGIAWVLAIHPDPAVREPQEAVKLAEQVAAATEYRHPMVLDTLAAAYAASGDFETAANAARRAIEIAEAAGAEELAAAVRGRLALYQAGVAFVAPAH